MYLKYCLFLEDSINIYICIQSQNFHCKQFVQYFLNKFMQISSQIISQYILLSFSNFMTTQLGLSPFIRLLAEVFLNCKTNARSAHSPQDHFIITLIISDRRDWHDTRGKRPLARNPDRSWWHHHTSLKLFWSQPMAP